MANQKQVESTEVMLEKSMEMLSEADLTRSNFDAKRQTFTRYFKALEAEHRNKICHDVASLLLTRFESSEKLDGPLYLLAYSIASERDWNAVIEFVSSLLSASSNADFFKEVAIGLMEIADNELDDKRSRIPLGHTTLVLLTELGLSLANRAGQSRLDNSGSARVVEYITTSMLARSNVNSAAMRMSLLHYLAKNPLNGQATQQLNRVIGRFGQSLLEDLFTSFFENKRRETAAFYFLLEHLNLFLSVSQSLAEMSHTVLRHFMLKYPEEFPRFLASYCERVSIDAQKLQPLTRHISLLVRTALEVSQRELAENLGAILYKHLCVFKDSHTPLFEEHVEMASAILSAEPQLKAAKGMIVGDILQGLRTLLLNDKDASKVVSLAAKARKSKEAGIKFAKVGEEPTPLESMLLLAS